MDRPALCPRAPRLLVSLIALLQVPLSAALPAPRPLYSNHTVEPDYAPREQVPPEDTWIETTSWPSTTYTPEPTAVTVQQIADGQVQAPYQPPTEDCTTTTTFESATPYSLSIPVPSPASVTPDTTSVIVISTTSSSDIASTSSSPSVEATSDVPSSSAAPVVPASVSTYIVVTVTTSSTSASPSSSQAASSEESPTSSSSLVQSSSAVVTSTFSSSSEIVTYSTTTSSSSPSSSQVPSSPDIPTSSQITSSSESVAAVSSEPPSSSSSSVATSSASPSSASPSSASPSSASPSSASPISTSTSTTTSTITQTTQMTVTVSASDSVSPLTSSFTSSTQIALPDNSLTSLTTSEVQTQTMSVMPSVTESAHTSLETTGNPSAIPFPTSLTTASTSLSLVDTSTVSATPTATANITSINVSNIFRFIATDAPPSQITTRSDHPVPTTGIQPQQGVLETNKFYANFFLGDQTSPAFTFPYSVSWSHGSGETKSWGMAVSHIERSQLAVGQARPDTGAWSFYANPIGVQSVVLSAAELTGGTTLTTDSLEGFSVNVNLLPAGASQPAITFPLVQGMAFVTGVYNGSTPVLSSGIGIKNVTYAGLIGSGPAYKYRIQLADGFVWLAYVIPRSSSYGVNTFTLVDPTTIQGPSGFNGYIQVAKIPGNSTDADSVYDSSAGAYSTAANITGSVNGTTGTYGLSWTKEGDTSKSLLMFALPHHVQSFSSQTNSSVTGVQLVTTTKGLGTAVLADSWTLSETDLPVSMDFAPWVPGQGSVSEVSAQAQALINEAGTAELAQNMSAQTDLNSMYFSGKGLAKFAAIIYAVHDMANNASLALAGLQELESAFAVFVNNQQIYPLVYDAVWGGAVSSGSYLTGDSGLDFGNTYYNDHHFHYGYFVYAAAVIAYLDPAWLEVGSNKAWVNMLVRDYANPVGDDPHFPFSRSFDWYHGHSWAKGLFDSADGKDQESSSEDTMASYGIKMWGRMVGDAAMEARGNLMLAVQARTLANYYLLTSDNTVEPAGFVPNKAGGILFENKIDHTTYFGTAVEYIEGIHMIPLMPFSSLTRRAAFVQQEWDTYFSTYAATVDSGWRGILVANQALIDPQASYAFFSNATGQFTQAMLDGGASQTWYLAFSAALGGSPASSAAYPRGLERLAVPELTGKESVARGNKVSDEVSPSERLGWMKARLGVESRRSRSRRRNGARTSWRWAGMR